MTTLEGSDTNLLLGFIETERRLSTEEVDQVERSEKKVKIGGGKFTGESSIPVSYADIHEPEGRDLNDDNPKLSYKQSILGLDDAHQQNY
jgi:hypothetical protein